MSFDKEEVDMDNPAFAQQDPHLQIADEDDQANLPPQFRNRFPRRPPLFDTMLNNVRAITKNIEHIKGFKFEMSGGLSNNFHLTSSWTIPYSSGGKGDKMGMPGMNPNKAPQVPHFTLGAQVLGGQLRTPFDQPSYIMTGRMESSGKLEAAFIKKINDWVSLRLSAFYMNSDPLNSQMHLDVDLTGNDYVHTIKFGTGLYSVNMMQTIGSKLVLGFEMMNLTERKATMMSYAAKYALNKRQMFYAQHIGPADAYVLAYNHKILPRAFLVSELSYINMTGDTKAVFGFRQRFATSEVIATVNSGGKMKSVLSINGMAYQLRLCAVADYVKEAYKFGYGISMGQVG